MIFAYRFDIIYNIDWEKNSNKYLSWTLFAIVFFYMILVMIFAEK